MRKYKFNLKYNRHDKENLIAAQALQLLENTELFTKLELKTNILPKKRDFIKNSSFDSSIAKISEHVPVAKSFKNLDIDFRLKQVHNFRYPRPLTDTERLAWPSLLAGRDMFLQAPFLKGHTLGYLIPLLQSAIDMRARGYPSALILCRSNDMARWVFFTAKLFAKHAGLSGLLFNTDSFGSALQSSLPQLLHGTDFLVASETALLRLLRVGSVDLRMVRFLVVDELHLFQWAEESRELLALLFAGLAKTPQIVCGAPKNAVRNQRFLDVLLKSMALPVQIKIKDDGMNAIRCKQFLVSHLARNKFQTVASLLLKNSPAKKTVVFVRDHVNALNLATALSERGIQSVTLDKFRGHENVSLLRAFKGRVPVLISQLESFPAKHLSTEDAQGHVVEMCVETVIVMDPPEGLWQHVLFMSAAGEGEGYLMVSEMDVLEEELSQYVGTLPRISVNV